MILKDTLTPDEVTYFRELFDRDPDLHDLTVVGAGLEEAFLALTRESDEPEPVA